jgi:hypothetical protein
MELVEVPPEMRPTGRKRHWAAGAMGIGEPCVGAIAVALQQSREAGEVVRGAFTAAAILEPIRHHRRACAAEGSVVARVGPEPRNLRFAGAGREGWQRRLVGEDALAHANVVQDPIGERLQMEPDPAHPAGHQIAGKLDVLATVDRFLAIERQAVGVLRDGDLGQEPLGRNPRLDQMRRRRRLHHLVAASGTGIARPARHDHPEPCRKDIEAFRYVLADLDPLGGAARTAGRCFRFDHDLDTFEMGRQFPARPRRAGLSRLGCRVQRRLDRAETGLDLFESELVLIGVERFRSPPVTRPLQRLNEGVQALDPDLCFGIGRSQLRRLGARREHHRLQRLDVFRKLDRGIGHARE